MTSKKKALGRGLDAILQSPEIDVSSREVTGELLAGAIAEIDIAKISVNPFQPRANFETESLEELSQSIRQQGIIQPLTVRKMGIDKYQLIAGERRLKAAEMAGLEEVPCYIRLANDEQMLEMALIENIHRKDLNAIEIAISYQRLIEELSLTQEDVSKKVGKDRATVSNYIRLLKLPPEIQYALRHDQITMGHARALISISDPDLQLKALLRIVEQGLSVRQAEKLTRDIQNPPAAKTSYTIPENSQKELLRLYDKLGSVVNVRTNNKGQGSIVIKYRSEEDLERILKLLNKD
jgi:ParB family chromosome partitioning protein